MLTVASKVINFLGTHAENLSVETHLMIYNSWLLSQCELFSINRKFRLLKVLDKLFHHKISIKIAFKISMRRKKKKIENKEHNNSIQRVA